MASSDSIFLLEIVVEDLISYIDCKDFFIHSQFADVFTTDLRDPNKLDTVIPKLNLKKTKKKTKVKKKSKQSSGDKVQLGQSILFASRIDTLITNMKNYPIEISLFSKNNVENKLGSTNIPWNPVYIDYLHKLQSKPNLKPVFVSGGYNVYDDFTSKRMATIRLNIKLIYLNGKRPPAEEHSNTLKYTGFNSDPTHILSTTKKIRYDYTTHETGTIKTFYKGGKRKINPSMRLKKPKESVLEEKERSHEKEQCYINEKEKQAIEEICTFKPSRLSLVKSDTDLGKNKQIDIIKTKSCSSINREQFKILNYIFGDDNRHFGNQVYCVGYFTVENDVKDDSLTKNSSKSPSTSRGIKTRLKLPHKCDCKTACECVDTQPSAKPTPSEETVNPPEDDSISFKICEHIDCEFKRQRENSLKSLSGEDKILLDISNKDCCDRTETIQELVGGLKAKMKFGDEPCMCSCECTFGFAKKTTFCKICGGYEKFRDDLSTKLPNTPFPCPIYHKLVDKNPKTGSKSAPPKPVGNTESEKELAKGKKKKKDDRFKFNYGYAAPQIGHSHCATPCIGTLGPVPRNMGWLWTADNVPGLKFRPKWKPGATNKHVVRLLRVAKNPEVALKKKKKDDGKIKKPVKRPLLMVKKKDGEYTVTMETMKTYPKTRALNQQPFEDKALLTYTIGRTDEENRERQKKKERARRRLERDQRNFIQSAFRNMCEEICLKTYQQALGILPDTEDPACECYPKLPGPDKTNLDISCSCSEDSRSIGSDTDSDEWIVEFTPPIATFDPTYKGKKTTKSEAGTQYTYLDYRVKLVDRYGNPVPRFFKGLDGKQQCSDLGGFWGPDHKWLEINVDGYIAPDGRWAPIAFTGPSGELVDCDTGKFQATNGEWLVVGVDGYIDVNNKWKFYPRPRGATSIQKKHELGTLKKGSGDKRDDKGKPQYKPSEATWSCFGDAKPKDLSKMGILGHGHDKELLLKTLQDMLAHGEDVKIPKPFVIPRLPDSKKGKGKRLDAYDSKTFFSERQKCKHAVPSDKGIVAVDEDGNKTYFRLKDSKNLRPQDRLSHLKGQGISLSSFHVPCFHSFINTEIMKKQQHERLMAMSQMQSKSTSHKCASTQAGARSRIAQ